MAGIIHELSRSTGLRSVDLRRIMSRAPRMYKFYQVEKRSGGLRQIAQPAREVKFVQRAFVEVLLAKLPIHPSATAYRKGTSIRENAARHAGDGPILKMDFKDFFHSIRAQDWIVYCQDNELGLDDEELDLTSRLLFHRQPGGRVLNLAIGAPSSPVLSNILMYKFDCAVLSNLENDQVRYSRYADDLTFSAPRTGFLNGIQEAVGRAIRETRYPRLKINHAKTTYVTRKYGRNVTGLTLANDGRVTIGREKKRLVHAAVHRAHLNRMNKSELQVLAGMLAYINSVEPEFLHALSRKYGEETLTKIKRAVYAKTPVPDHPPPLARTINTKPREGLSLFAVDSES